MKKVLAALAVVAVLGFGVLAFADGMGGGYGSGGYGGGMMGGNGMMGGGMMGGNGMMGGGMMGGNGYGNGYGYGNDKETKDFMEKSSDLRREMNKLRFEFDEAYRSGDEVAARRLYKSMEELAEKIRKMAPRGSNFPGGSGGYRR